LVSEGDPPTPGDCPGCGARYVGGTERPQGAAQAALAAFGIAGDPETLTRALFDIGPESGVAVTSDRRDGFYGWWVFVSDDATTRLATLAFERP
jgi:hypothetical protein